MHFPYKRFFEAGLDIFVPITGCIGVYSGIYAYSLTQDEDAYCLFRNMITYTCIGIFIGVTYPISFPVISGYTLYTNYVQGRNFKLN